MKSYAEIAKECRCHVEDVEACMAEVRDIGIPVVKSGNTDIVNIVHRFIVPTDASAYNANENDIVAFAEADTKTEAVTIALKRGWRPDSVNV